MGSQRALGRSFLVSVDTGALSSAWTRKASSALLASVVPPAGGTIFDPFGRGQTSEKGSQVAIDLSNGGRQA